MARRLSIEQRVAGFPQGLVEAKEAELAKARWVSSTLRLQIGEKVLFRRRIRRNRLRLMKSSSLSSFGDWFGMPSRKREACQLSEMPMEFWLQQGLELRSLCRFAGRYLSMKLRK